MPHTTVIDTNTAATYQHTHQEALHSSNTGSSSPTAPAYSPITPKVQPALPVNGQLAFVPPDNGGNFTFSVGQTQSQTHQQTDSQANPIAPPAHYIPQPPDRPFSSDDAADAIALRAAISTLQFQKKKAQEDLKALQNIKQLALDDPSHFKAELAAGNLNEQRPKLGDLRTILDENDDSDDSDDSDSVKLGATQGGKSVTPEIPDSQPSSHTTSFAENPGKMDVDPVKQFPPIPGPQSVVRMPFVNWDKYGVVGEPLESLHGQQQRWPGSNPHAPEKGREYTVAAPFSPWLDNLVASPTHADGFRKDSAATSTSTPVMSATGTISEHPMETRSRQ